MRKVLTWRIRVHEWLADRFTFVQYPDIRPRPYGYQPPTLRQRWRNLTRKQRAWICFAVFWTFVLYLMGWGA